MTDQGNAPPATDDVAPPAWVAAACDETPLSARRARWGFRHATWIADLPGGRRIVVQRRTGGPDTTSTTAGEIRERVRATGLAVPEPALVPGIPGDPVVVLPHVEGVVAADLLATREGAIVAGRACGVAAARLAAVDGPEIPLPDPAASSAALEAALRGRSSPPGVAEAMRHAVGRTRAEGARFAHGDLAPVNVLVEGDRPVALLDLDRARLAHPRYDAAWFGWVLAYHHPDVAGECWAAFREAAGLGTVGIDALAWLWPLQLAERVAEARDDAEGTAWEGILAASVPG